MLNFLKVGIPQTECCLTGCFITRYNVSKMGASTLCLGTIVEKHDDWVTKKLVPEAISTFRDFVRKHFE